MTTLRRRAIAADEVTGTGAAVLVADAHSLLREGLRQVLQAELPGCRIIEADRLAAALAILRHAAADLFLLNLALPGMRGADSLHTLRSIYPALKIGVVSEVADRLMVADCLAAGVNGFIFDQEPIEEVAFAVNTMLMGRIYVTPSIANTGPVRPAQGAASTATSWKVSGLTLRQMEVLGLLAQGRSNKEIGRGLELSESTVKIHLAAVYRVLGARNRTEAVVIAGRVRL